MGCWSSLPVEYVSMIGDMVGASGGDAPAYDVKTVYDEAKAVFPSLTTDRFSIIWADHDAGYTDPSTIGVMKCPEDETSTCIYSAPDHSYYIYAVNYNEMLNYGTAAPEAFKTWVDGIDKSAFIIVVCHAPMHYKRGDNKNGLTWSNALNYAATGSETGTEVTRNVVFFHGHNHTVDKTEYYYAPGSTVTMQGSSSTSSTTIRYTYITAGYNKSTSTQNATLLTLTDQTAIFTKSNSGTTTELGSVERVAQDLRPVPVMSFDRPIVACVYEEGMPPFVQLPRMMDGENPIPDKPFTYTSDNEDVATVSPNGEVTIHQAGRAVITAFFEGDGEYKEATASFEVVVMEHLLEFQDAEPHIAFGTEDGHYRNPLIIAMDGVEVEYTSSDPGTATVDEGGQVTILRAGEVTITATQTNPEEGMEPVSTQYTLTIEKGMPVLTYVDGDEEVTTLTKTVGASSFRLAASTNVTGANIVYSSSDETVARVTSNGTVTVMGIVGTTTITATLAETDNYEAATASYELTVVTPTSEMYQLATALENGGEYLIVSSKTDGSAYALGHSGTTKASDDVTINAASAGISDVVYVSADEVEGTSVWTATTSGSGFTLSNGGYYLEASGSASAISIKTSATSSRYWTYSSEKLGFVGGNSTHYIYYSDGFVSAKNSSYVIYLYKKVSGTAVDPTTYAVNFVVNGGSLVDEQRIAEGGYAIEPDVPIKDNCSFDGWYIDELLETPYDFSTPVNAELTLYAKWTSLLVSHTVTFATNGGTEIEPITVADGETIEQPDAPVKEGFLFDGWYADEELTTAFDFDRPIDADVVLYAKWRPEAPQKCALPVVAYVDGKVLCTCETENVKFVYSIGMPEFTGESMDGQIPVGTVLQIRVKAVRPDFEDSDVAQLDIDLAGDAGLLGDINHDGKVTIADVTSLVNIILGK